MVPAVVPVVFGASPGSKGHMRTDNGIADVALAGNVGIVVNDRVLHLRTVSDIAVRAGVNTSIEAGVKIGVARTTQPGSYIGKDLL